MILALPSCITLRLDIYSSLYKSEAYIAAETPYVKNLQKELLMTSFKDRQNAFENKYANDQEKFFRIEARMAKLFGLWGAEKLGLGEADAKTYAASVVSENLNEAGYDDIRRKVLKDLQEKGITLTDHAIDTALEECLSTAQAQIEAE